MGGGRPVGGEAAHATAPAVGSPAHSQPSGPRPPPIPPGPSSGQQPPPPIPPAPAAGVRAVSSWDSAQELPAIPVSHPGPPTPTPQPQGHTAVTATVGSAPPGRIPLAAVRPELFHRSKAGLPRNRPGLRHSPPATSAPPSGWPLPAQRCRRCGCWSGGGTSNNGRSPPGWGCRAS